LPQGRRFFAKNPPPAVTFAADHLFVKQPHAVGPPACRHLKPSMSLHAIKPETEARLRQQRRLSFISSTVIGFLVVILVLLILSFLLLTPLFKETPTIVTYQAQPPAEEELADRKIRDSVERKPAAPASAMARVIAANTQAPVAVPVSDTAVTTPSVDFGDGDDFGNGWGGGGDGTGGGATFFNQRVKAQRVAYVIDYSQSMKGPREKLMRNELRKSVGGLLPGMSFQLIFFAGPAWVAGNQVQMAGHRSATVTADRKKYDWVCGGKAHDWEPKGAKQQADWLTYDARSRKESLTLIDETSLVWGTNWEPALTMALAMDPPPEVVFFMTDGVTGGDAVALAKSIAAKARGRKITINTVAMMEPRAEEAMKELAKRTEGQFTVIEAGGKVRQVPLN
jgi:hypothetical protein